MNIFAFEDYKELLGALISEPGKGGHGTKARIARHMGVHTTFITHVMGGKSHFSNEQALKVCDFFLLTELETDFFVTLVQFNRAGDKRTNAFFSNKLKALKREGMKLKEQLRKQTVMTPEEQAIFYSEWCYSAARLTTALPNGGTVEEVARLLNLPIRQVEKIMDFLLKTGLCKVEKKRLTYGAFATYVGSDSPFAKKLHDNWRMRSIQYGMSHDEDLMFTSVVTLTMEDFIKLREIILVAIKKFEQITDDSPSKVLAYLNIDWVRIV